MSTLDRFYRALQAWIDKGCPPGPVFDPHYGMCYQARTFGGHWLRFQLQAHFKAQGLDPATPFNEDIVEYAIEESNWTLWKNPKRLAWVSAHAIALP